MLRNAHHTRNTSNPANGITGHAPKAVAPAAFISTANAINTNHTRRPSEESDRFGVMVHE